MAVGDGVCTGLGDWLPQVRGDLLLLDLECEDVVLEADEPNVKNDTGVETFLCFVDEGEFSCEAVGISNGFLKLSGWAVSGQNVLIPAVGGQATVGLVRIGLTCIGFTLFGLFIGLICMGSSGIPFLFSCSLHSLSNF